jgi:hypothetical protein
MRSAAGFIITALLKHSGMCRGSVCFLRCAQCSACLSCYNLLSPASDGCWQVMLLRVTHLAPSCA